MRLRQVHLDFHTGEHIPNVGSEFNKEQFQEALKVGHVDSVTVFSKCHHGWAYHPSKANDMHPNLHFDLMGAQIRAAHEIGVKTPVYLSAGFDENAVTKHPQWLRWGSPDFTPNYAVAGYHLLCLNTPYLDYLLAQIREVCENYDADGIFLDIVGTRPCYCPCCMEALAKEGKTAEDPQAVMELAERVFVNYLHRVRETVDSVKPGLPVFHNAGHVTHGRRDLAAMNTHLELESLPTGGWGYDHFPLSARYAQGLGMEYLGMTGKFHGGWGEFGGFKHPNALRYEVSLAAANGAGNSVGDQLHPSGLMDMATYRLIGEAYGELEQKEPWIKGARPVADVALLSLEAYSSQADPNRNTKSDIGAGRILLEGKYLFDVVDLDSDLSGYKVVVLPDLERITPSLKQKLDAYLVKGGKLLATGKSGLLAEEDRFAFDFGAEYVGQSEKMPCYIRPEFSMEGLYPADYVLYAQAEDVILKDGTALAHQKKPYFNRTPEHFCSHGHTPNDPEIAGPGMTQGAAGIYIGWQIFREYACHGSLIAKRVVQYALDKLLGEAKTLVTNLGAQGVVTLTEQDGRYVNHLLYAAAVKRGENVEVIEDILPIYGVEVALHLPKRIKRVYLAPQEKDISFCQDGDVVRFMVDKLECHQMVALEYEK